VSRVVPWSPMARRSIARGDGVAVMAAAALALVACGDSGGGTGGAGSTTTSGGDGGSGGEVQVSVAVSSSSAVTTASSSSSSSSGGFINCAGGYATFQQGPCDLLQQDCDPGFHCTWKSAGGGDWTTECVPRGGLKGLAAECEVETECEAGLTCFFDVCTPICCPGNEQPCGGGSCNLLVSLDADDTVRLCTYSQQCTPLTADACPEDTFCHFEEPTVSTCVPSSGEDALQGEPCMNLNDCGDMQQCAVDADDTCRFICELDPNSQPPGFGGCPIGQDCRTTPLIEIDGLGICDDE
jgi:hypothetical protein